MIEIWEDIKGFEGCYKVSNIGNVKSLERKEWCIKNNSFSLRKEKILIPFINKRNYLIVTLYKKSKPRLFGVHQLVGMAFLNHKPNGHTMVINHINFNPSDNRVENIEVVTQRQNANRKHLKSSSEYVGVCWNKDKNKWTAQIYIKPKQRHLGAFINEYDAHLAYQKEISIIKSEN